MKYNPMETAPKDETPILVWNVDNYLTEGEVGQWMLVFWTNNFLYYPNSKPVKQWCQVGSWQDEQGGYNTADNPICWTNLPDSPE